MVKNKAKIVEVFSSIQGEGLYIGQAQTFVRFYGCNLDCGFCDEKRKNTYKEYLSKELIAAIIEANNRVVSLTGGEPLLYAGFLKEVLPYLKEKGFIAYLETNGTLKNKLLEIIDFLDIISMDIKLPSSTGLGAYWKAHTDFLKEAARKNVFVKVVITDKTSLSDMKRAVAIIKGINKDIFFILQPATINNRIQKMKPTRAKARSSCGRNTEPAIVSAAGECIKYADRFLNIANSSLNNVRLIPQIHRILDLR